MAVSYAQIEEFSGIVDKVTQAALSEFLDSITTDMSTEELMEVAAEIAWKFSIIGSELGAEWYELCALLADVDVDPAELMDMDEVYYEDLLGRAGAATEKAMLDKGSMNTVFGLWLKDEINNSIRTTGDMNLNRDYQRGIGGGRWCRVPVGDTCAWCLMLASQGAWYKSKETALGITPDHYHKGCDCKAVYYSDGTDIDGYTDLIKYKDMYYKAEDRRLAAERGIDPYPDELRQKIEKAKETHNKKHEEWVENGKKKGAKFSQKWTVYHETLIVLRSMNGLEH